ncbi:hypothetical protein [Lacticaseibacillus parakribbianus]|uniref:hypothetical protein n=1 Tax=Lacticaseibacillus parakribbianus TaxID=2970927 RepID=UPI0021CB1187|nr:hypothetical protein [Lacticaseibacillus parakribbianus]
MPILSNPFVEVVNGMNGIKTRPVGLSDYLQQRYNARKASLYITMQQVLAKVTAMLEPGERIVNMMPMTNEENSAMATDGVMGMYAPKTEDTKQYLKAQDSLRGNRLMVFTTTRILFFTVIEFLDNDAAYFSYPYDHIKKLQLAERSLNYLTQKPVNTQLKMPGAGGQTDAAKSATAGKSGQVPEADAPAAERGATAASTTQAAETTRVADTAAAAPGTASAAAPADASPAPQAAAKPRRRGLVDSIAQATGSADGGLVNAQKTWQRENRMWYVLDFQTSDGNVFTESLTKVNGEQFKRNLLTIPGMQDIEVTEHVTRNNGFENIASNTTLQARAMIGCMTVLIVPVTIYLIWMCIQTLLGNA